MSDLLRQIADGLAVWGEKISTRTIRRWFENGVIRGRKTKGGHWKLRRAPFPRMETLTSAQMLDRSKAGRAVAKLAFAVYSAAAKTGKGNTAFYQHMACCLAPARPLPPEARRAARRTIEDKRLVAIALEWHGLSYEEMEEEGAFAKLEARDPDRARLYADTSVADLIRQLPLKVKKAQSEKTTDLFFAAKECVRCGQVPSGANIAKQMKMSRATLYRRFSSTEIMQARSDAESANPLASKAKRNGKTPRAVANVNPVIYFDETDSDSQTEREICIPDDRVNHEAGGDYDEMHGAWGE